MLSQTPEFGSPEASLDVKDSRVSAVVEVIS